MPHTTHKPTLTEVTDVNLEAHKDLKDTMQVLQNSIEVGMNVLIPVAKTYLTELRSIRMAFGQEVIHIVESSRQVRELVKHEPEFKKLVGTLLELDSALNDDLIAKLRRIIKE